MKILSQNLLYLPVSAPATNPASFYTPGVNMGKAESIQFIVSVGTLSTADYTIFVGCSATAKSTAYDVDLPFRYMKSAAAGTDSMGTMTNVAVATGINFANASDSNKSIVIDVNTAELTQGYPYVQLYISRSGSATAVGLIVEAIYQPRYPQLSSTQGSGVGLFT